MIDLHSYDSAAAYSVLTQLDPSDHFEAELMRGVRINSAEIFADWHHAQAHSVLSFVIFCARRRVPFAVLVLANTGQSGVASAAFLSRDHVKWRRHIAVCGARIRADMPEFCEKAGIRRVEVRSWSGHPTANQFLRACGFNLEAAMPGFGPDGLSTFNQFAFVAPSQRPMPSSSGQEN
ncbi:MAG: hypothetical protein AAF582_00115 [Pseudomonadota bacterium]